MSHYLFENNVRTALAANVLAGDTSITIDKAVAPYKNPETPTGGLLGFMTLTDNLFQPTKIEIVTYSGVTDNGATLTLTGVVRGMDGTTAQAFTTGDPAYQSFVAMIAERVQNPASVHITGGTIDGVAITNATGVAKSGAVTASGLTASATARLIGRHTSGAGALEQIQIGTGLTLSGDTLSVAIGSTVQAYSANLVSWAALVPGTMATQNANAVSITGGTSRMVGYYANLAGAEGGFVWNETNGPLRFGTNNTLRGRFTADGVFEAYFGAAVTGTISSTLGVVVSANGGSFASGKIYRSAESGMIVSASTGSATDFLLATPSGGSVFSVPTGTTNVNFAGTVSATRGSIGDVVSWQGGSKIGYLFSDNGYIGFGDAANGSGNGLLIGEGTPKIYANINGSVVTTTQAGLFAVTGAISASTGFTSAANSARSSEYSGALVIVPSGGSAGFALGVDNANGQSFISSWNPGVSWIGRPLHLQPNGGTVLTGGPLSVTGNLHVGAGLTGRLGVRGTTADSSASAFEALNSSGVGLFDVRNDGRITALAGYCYDAETDQGAVSGAVTVDWPSRHRRRIELSGNTTLTFTSPGKPCSLILKVVTHASSGASHTITWPASVKWAGGVAPDHRTGNSKLHIYSFYFDGTSYIGSAMLDCA
jgi:hypothetical protein